MTVVLALVVVVVVAIALVAVANARGFSDANEVIPGIDTGAPPEWAGAHSPEARLHRRIRDAMTALRTNTMLDDPAMTGVRAALEDEAVRVDRRLVAVAALAPRLRSEPMAQVEEAVDAIETAVADVVGLRGPSVGDVQAAIDHVRQRVQLVAEARRELEALSSPDLSSAMDTLRSGLEADETAPSDDDGGSGGTPDPEGDDGPEAAPQP